MKLLAYIMTLNHWTIEGDKYFFLYPLYSKIIDHAHKKGLVYRLSFSQVHWTEKGIKLYRKYM